LLINRQKPEIAKTLNVEYEPDEQLLESENRPTIYGVDAITTIPLIDFNSEHIGAPPLPPSLPPNFNAESNIVRPIGFNLPSPPDHKPSSSHTSPTNNGDASGKPQSKLDKLADELNRAAPQPKAPIDRSPPPNYDSVIAGPSAPPGTNTSSPQLPNQLPNSSNNGGAGDGDESDIDFEDLAKRFEALKRAK
jgi:hypothetical protein